MRRARLLYVPFAITGFSALLLQVTWQRVISIHSGIDLSSSTTVVSAFMAGLGLGNLAGGALADRLGPLPSRAVLAFAASTAGIGLFGLGSIFLLYDVYQWIAPHLVHAAAAFAFHFLLLLIPTTLMGLSLPLLARGAVESPEEAPARVGRLYAVNTAGAALGAGLGTWAIVGNLGFTGTVRLASALELLAAALVLVALRRPSAERATAAPAPAPAEAGHRAWPWYVLYGLTGAVALGFEIVYFRVVDALMRSNSYTFGHVLFLYLLLFAGGASFGSRRAPRSPDPGSTFLWLQLWIGVSSLLGLIALVNVPPVWGMRRLLEDYFATDGYAVGLELPSSGRALATLIFVHLTGPLVVMGAPVFLMGAAYPYAQRAVTRGLEDLGRRTGGLLFSNITGNVAGSVITGFVLLDRIGTARTVLVLAGALAIAGLAAAWRGRRWRRGAVAAVAVAAAVAIFPSNVELWRFLHAARPDRFALVEERTCVNTLVRQDDGEEVLFVNAASQNGWPYDDFHVLLGMMPSLMHDSPRRALAIGLGTGSTAWGFLVDERLGRVEAVELCAGQPRLLSTIAARSAEIRRIGSDGRLRIEIADGRRHLLVTGDAYDVVAVDALRPNAAYAGNVYSLEFYRLVLRHLNPSGLFAQWIPTPRVTSTAAVAFPHVVLVTVPGNRGSFLIASPSPVRLDRDRILGALASPSMKQAFSEEQHASLTVFFQEVALQSQPAGEVGREDLNRDLFPRDEYWLNDG